MRFRVRALPPFYLARPCDFERPAIDRRRVWLPGLVPVTGFPPLNNAPSIGSAPRRPLKAQPVFYLARPGGFEHPAIDRRRVWLPGLVPLIGFPPLNNAPRNERSPARPLKVQPPFPEASSPRLDTAEPKPRDPGVAPIACKDGSNLPNIWQRRDRNRSIHEADTAVPRPALVGIAR